MSQHPPTDWKYLAERASTEMDPVLMDLISELNRALAERDQPSIKHFPPTESVRLFSRSAVKAEYPTENRF